MKATPCIGQVSKPIDFKEFANKFVLTVIKFYEKLIYSLWFPIEKNNKIRYNILEKLA